MEKYALIFLGGIAVGVLLSVLATDLGSVAKPSVSAANKL